jgi:hypothetical protein
MEDNEGIARFAFELEQQEIIPDDPHGSEIDRNPLSALRTTHLAFDTLDDLG